MTGVYATAQVARICHISPATVRKLCDAGHLPSWRLPGSKNRRGGHRRIGHGDLVRFFEEHDLPMRWLAELQNTSS